MVGDVTGAQAMLFRQGMGKSRSGAGRKRKRRTKRTSSRTSSRTRRKRRASSPRKKRAPLVKGSAAAKRYMAKIRRKRRK
jgi:hypothetical protein